MMNILNPSQSNFTLGSLAGIFRSPSIPTQAYNPGQQIYDPGQSFQPQLGGLIMNPVPCASMVPTLNCMTSFYGFPRQNPVPVVNNRWAPLFNNNMFLGGVIAKS